MNVDLIRKLRSEATVTKEISHGDVDTYFTEFNEDKFVELIVRECATIADTERPNSLGCGYITKTKGMLIKEHFGVEE